MSGLPDLDSDETLGRAVISRRAANRARRTGMTDLTVFLERVEAASVSVDRMDHASLETMATLARERAGARTPPRQFRGWAVLPVRDAASSGRTVDATPLEGNPYHADIFLNLGDAAQRDQQRWHAAQLAARST